MIRRLTIVAVAIGMLGITPSLAGVASASTIVVGPGESIQAAIDAAHPGDVIKVEPGVYRENVEITTDGLTLQGSGASYGGTVLLPPAEPAPRICQLGDPGLVSGICVTGDVNFETFPFEVLDPVEGVRIAGFRIKGFPFNGVFVLGGKGTKINRNVAKDNEEYGFFANTSTGTSFYKNKAFGSEEAGFYVGDSPNAKARLVKNVSRGNGLGFFLRDASNGGLYRNKAKGNCIGMLFLDTYADPANWRAYRNLVAKNTKACPENEEEGSPPLSGMGIAIVGTDAVKLARNTIVRNAPSGPTFASGGVVVVSSIPFGGSDPNDTKVRRNRILKNEAFDIFWDGSGSGNVFVVNRCQTSEPTGLC